LISLNLLKLRAAVSRTAVIGKLSLEWSHAPFLWASAVIFPGRKRRHFAHTFQFADDAMQTDVYKALYPFYTKKSLHFSAVVTKIRFVGSNSQVYFNKLQTRLSADFKQGTFLQRSILPWSLTEQHLCLYFI